jgi:hypothetical protein
VQPAGTYLVVAAEEPIERQNFTVHRRVATMMHIPANPSPSQTCHVVEVDPEELRAALKDNGDVEDTPLEGMVSAAARHPEVLSVEHPRTSIGIVLRYGIWQLTRNGHFYGDYLTQQEACRQGHRRRPGRAANGSTSSSTRIRRRPDVRCLSTSFHVQGANGGSSQRCSQQRVGHNQQNEEEREEDGRIVPMPVIHGAHLR